MDTRYLRTLKTALTGTAAPLVLVCNFEVEAQWAQGYVGLPNAGLSTSTALVQRMEELGALLAGPADTLVLKRPLDPDYRAHLHEAGLDTPTVLVPEHQAPDRSTTEDALASPLMRERLAARAADGAHLLPMGTSAAEQKLAGECGLPLAVPDAATCERVNGKTYGRQLAAACGLRCIPGAEVGTVSAFATALADYRETVSPERPVVAKDSYGVSGKGLVVLDSPAKCDRLVRMVERRAARTGDDRLHVVVEEWLPKRYDLNYQLTIARDGGVALDFVKQALTANGVHKGHVVPADLTSTQYAEVEHAAHVLGEGLRADGFTGVVGVDAVVADDGTLYPALELNARLNMSTYQGSVAERRQSAGAHALARHYTIRRTGPLPFAEVRRALGPLLAPGTDDRGQAVVTCFGTAQPPPDVEGPANGRLYTYLIAPDRPRLTALDTAVERALAPLSSDQEDR